MGCGPRDFGGAKSSIACYWPDTGRLESIAAFPELPSLAERGLADGVGPLYQRCHDRGELLVLGSRISDVGLLLREGYERWGPPSLIACDRWRLGRTAGENGSVADPGMRGRGARSRLPGWRTGHYETFRAAVVSGAVTPVPSLLLRSALAEARTVGDAAANEKLSQGQRGRPAWDGARRRYGSVHRWRGCWIPTSGPAPRTPRISSSGDLVGQAPRQATMGSDPPAGFGARQLALLPVRSKWPPRGRPYQATPRRGQAAWDLQQSTGDCVGFVTS